MLYVYKSQEKKLVFQQSMWFVKLPKSYLVIKIEFKVFIT